MSDSDIDATETPKGAPRLHDAEYGHPCEKNEKLVPTFLGDCRTVAAKELNEESHLDVDLKSESIAIGLEEPNMPEPAIRGTSGNCRASVVLEDSAFRPAENFTGRHVGFDLRCTDADSTKLECLVLGVGLLHSQLLTGGAEGGADGGRSDAEDTVIDDTAHTVDGDPYTAAVDTVGLVEITPLVVEVGLTAGSSEIRIVEGVPAVNVCGEGAGRDVEGEVLNVVELNE